ncbi:hypothetical protein ACFV1N_37215 [Streptosporangium canum]|uniref:hypothetical protein n=1 Tax=Streptosporangium canum TaxID=324952 RepID=UPI003673E2B4
MIIRNWAVTETARRRLLELRLEHLVVVVEADVDRLARQEQRLIDLAEQVQAGRGPQMTALQAHRQELERTAEADLPKALAAAEQADRRLQKASILGGGA